jgi:hypothetical protein
VKTAPSHSYRGPTVSYGIPGGRRPSYGPPPIKGKLKEDFSNYYRTRSGGWGREPSLPLRSLQGYKYTYSTIGYPNTRPQRMTDEYENGQSEAAADRQHNDNKFNWENDGWTIAH